MLKLSLLFFVLAVAVLLVGLTGGSESSVDLGRTLLGISIGIVALNFIGSLTSSGHHSELL